jgi:glycosyltransferase involved in cell wall biosynthesis
MILSQWPSPFLTGFRRSESADAKMICPELSAVPRIKTLLHAFPTFEIGGSQLRFAALANHFGPRYRHVIVAMNGKTECRERLDKTVPFEILAIDAPKRSTLRNFVALRRTLKDLNPDLLITYNWGAIEWALANLIPICRHVHIEDGFGPDEAISGQMPRRALFRRLVLSARTQVVLPSQTLIGIATTIWRLPKRRLHYVPNGIDCARFAVEPDIRHVSHLRRSPGELLIGTVAALRPEKNIGRLIEAFAKVAAELPVRLVIVGDGVERQSLERLVACLGLNGDVVFMGAMPDPERILGALDLFALSSDTEQMPYSVLEAMAAGLAIAAVDVGDVRKMVTPENRPMVVARSTERLAEAIRTLLRDSSARAEIGRGNRALVRRCFDQATMFERYAALFDA